MCGSADRSSSQLNFSVPSGTLTSLPLYTQIALFILIAKSLTKKKERDSRERERERKEQSKR